MLLNRTREEIQKVDEKLSYQLFKSVPKTKELKSLLKGLEFSCNGIIWLSGTFILLYVFPTSILMKRLLVGLIMDIVYVALTKAYARRVRPKYAPQDDQFGVISVDKHSFPSGHATRAVYVAFFASVTTHPIISFIVWIWCIAVCTSRVLLGRHHIADVVAGVVIGFTNYLLQFVIGFPIYPVIQWLVTGFASNFASKNDMEDADMSIDD